MKKVLLVSLLVVLVAFAVFARPASMDKFYNASRQMENGKIDFNVEKDSMAIAAGCTAILDLGGDMRGFAPCPLTSITSNKAGDTLQVITALFNSGTGLFTGVYYTFSDDGGATWSTPLLTASAIAGSRQYNCLAVSDDGLYPYIAINNRRSSAMFGVWFTTDVNGPNGGGWTTPVLISDTMDYMAYMPSLTVNSDGSKVALFAYDMAYAYGFNASTDYGTTWGAYTYSDSLVAIDYMDVSNIVWGPGNYVYGFLGTVLAGEERSDIAGSGANSGIIIASSWSDDGGATYDIYQRPLYGTEYWTDIATLNGDTITYYVEGDTTNGTVDSVAVKAYLDPSTGMWADETAAIDGNYGFGTWWYWWDSEYYPEMAAQFFAVPMADLFVDYYVEANRLYTFPWQGQSITFGWKGDMETEFTYDYIDIHDADILNTAGMTATFNGNAYSANLVFDKRDKAMYIVYIDYPDTVTGEASAMALKIDNYEIYRANLIPNTGAYEMEAARYVGDNGEIHIAFVSGSQDSIYYKSVDVDDVTTWEYIGVSQYSGICDNKVAVSKNGTTFNIPSIVKNEASVSFSLASNADVKIALYDVTGREVKMVANGSFTKGAHTVNMNTNGLSQGVYFAKVNAGSFSTSKKVVVVK